MNWNERYGIILNIFLIRRDKPKGQTHRFIPASFHKIYFLMRDIYTLGYQV